MGITGSTKCMCVCCVCVEQYVYVFISQLNVCLCVSGLAVFVIYREYIRCVFVCLPFVISLLGLKLNSLLTLRKTFMMFAPGSTARLCDPTHVRAPSGQKKKGGSVSCVSFIQNGECQRGF